MLAISAESARDMNTENYSYTDASGRPLIGRESQQRQLWSDLTKETPSHVSLVGPRSSGKSMLIRTVCERLKNSAPNNATVVYWDFSIAPPVGDEAFLREFAVRVGDCIRDSKPTYADYLGEGTYPVIREVMQALYKEEVRIFMAWDSFDRALLKGNYTGHLWDNLCNLAESPAWVVTTATRRPLLELISNQSSWTSKFWGTFGRQVFLSALTAAELEIALTLYPELVWEKGAISELANWTGNYPPLVLAMLEGLHERHGSATMTATVVNDIGKDIALERSNLLGSLWNDHGQSSKELYIEVIRSGVLEDAGRKSAVKTALVETSLIDVAGTRIRSRNRLMEEYVKAHDEGMGSLAHQFGNPTSFCKNQRSVLQLRLDHVGGIDSRLHRNIEICLSDLPDDPGQCMQRLRDSVMARAIHLLFEKELGSRMEIPDDWITYWSSLGINDRFMTTKRCPEDFGARMKFLGQVANPMNGEPRAKYISPLAYEMCQALKRLGDFGVHPKGEPFSPGVALAAVSLSIELAGVIVRDLSAPRQV